MIKGSPGLKVSKVPPALLVLTMSSKAIQGFPVLRVPKV